MNNEFDLRKFITEGRLLKENIDENNLKLYHDVLIDIGGTDLAGDYKDMLLKANDFKSFSDFVKDDISILSQDDTGNQVNDIKSNFVEAKLRKMSPEEFISFTKSMGDYDFWSDAPNGIDPFNNIGQRMDVLSTNDDEDTNKYFNALIKLKEPKQGIGLDNLKRVGGNYLPPHIKY